MAMEGKLVNRNGKLFVLYQTSSYSKPEITYMWWLIESVKGNSYHCDRPEEGDIAVYQSDGRTWQTRRPDTHRSTGTVWTVGDGNTKADHVETVSAPSPKVRNGIEIRWHEGRYEKLLKKGWVPA
jgi:hypothetical protein